MSDELLKEILAELRGVKNEVKQLKTEMNQRFDEMNDSIERKHIENIKAGESLLHMITDVQSKMATKEDTERIHKRLDYQILRIARTEEEIHLLKPEKQ
ncbi:hypothetical protein [Aneurinibacillus migulanus]|uniref:Uncharacterized protein n=1 Tax=Aneurinibacillus migulanus TaxID=47500 RepID=A0A0D1VE07_ANEMI|nr:hypothetical protein [Aneurinibacillus migulanus]KIV57659.1 hypothetical protein TS65_09005 [Aneurinibacillus migulanus]KON95878.1 hypothetical protein AF333_10680 [Aneurinibacillus migulanus]MED0891972.1 hypothetical protein [Aneurinibacillus migulanus]MED1617288.1 hypothetical protein [Aneurinibacillus migulanus]SDK27003.1 hypothetical protein SAMN04487909_14643 [Aneurinibacillus migulanus]